MLQGLVALGVMAALVAVMLLPAVLLAWVLRAIVAPAKRPHLALVRVRRDKEVPARAA